MSRINPLAGFKRLADRQALVRLADGRGVKGFIVEAADIAGAALKIPDTAGRAAICQPVAPARGDQPVQRSARGPDSPQ